MYGITRRDKIKAFIAAQRLEAKREIIEEILAEEWQTFGSKYDVDVVDSDDIKTIAKKHGITLNPE